MTGTRFTSNRDRHWNWLLSERWSHIAGELTVFLPRKTEIAILLEGRVHLRRRGDDGFRDPLIERLVQPVYAEIVYLALASRMLAETLAAAPKRSDS